METRLGEEMELVEYHKLVASGIKEIHKYLNY